MGEEEREKKWVEQESWIWSQSRQDMRNAHGRITIQGARIGAHRMTMACPDSPTSASQKQHQAGWSSIALLLGGIHATVLFILSSASTFQGGSEKHPRSPHAARHMLHSQRVNAGVRLSKQWPVACGRSRTSQSAAAGRRRHSTHAIMAGALAEEPLGNSRFASFFFRSFSLESRSGRIA